MLPKTSFSRNFGKFVLTRVVGLLSAVCNTIKNRLLIKFPEDVLTFGKFKEFTFTEVGPNIFSTE